MRDQLARNGQVLVGQGQRVPGDQAAVAQRGPRRDPDGRYRTDPGHLGSHAEPGGRRRHARRLGDRVRAAVCSRCATPRCTSRANQLTASALVTESDLRTALPILQSVEPVASGNGQLTLRGTATLLGVSATVDATVAAVNGSSVVQPDVPFGGLATVTVFSNPHVYVEGVAARQAPGGFVVSARARLR